jgi:23S rRNA (cytosine1962-C5)-methyltransferase
MQLLVDIQGGHKTGYYLDQRDSRLATRRYVADKRVLNSPIPAVLPSPR